MLKRFVTLSLMLWFPTLLGQTAVQTPAQPPAQATQGQTSNWNQRIQQLSFTNTTTDYKLGAGDLIQVDVFGIENFRQTLRISSSGAITMPYLGTVKAAGLTAMELEDSMRKMLVDGNFIKNPQVTVFVAEYRSQVVFVLGAVQKPGQYMITQPIRLIDAIGMAGGLNLEQAEDYAIIQTKANAGQAPQPGQTPQVGQAASNTIRVQLKELLEDGKIDLNVPINGGDIIQVPERQIQRFYVLGDVNHPGAFELPKNEEINVTKALAWAGGVSRTAKKSKGILVRQSDGRRRELAVNVDDILKGKKPDVPVQANDVLFLPGSTAKGVGLGLLGVIPGTVSSSVIWGALRR